MKTDTDKTVDPGFEQHEDEINWTAGAGRPAGIFWLNGRWVMATHDTAAEQRLISIGAVLVATLRYDADPLERVHRRGTVERMEAERASREFRVSAEN